MQCSCFGRRLWMAFLLLVAACGGSQTGGAAEITLSMGNSPPDVRSVEYDIDCQDGVSFEGRMNVVPDRDPPIWEAFVGLPVGPCTIVLTAVGEDGQPICSGSTEVEVIANRTVKANVELLCPVTGGEATGNIDIDGRFSEIPVDICPIIHFMTAVPTELLPTEDTSVIQVRASDPDMSPEPLSIELRADRGELTAPNASDSMLICPAGGGQVEVTAKVSDGSPQCDQDQSVTVFCPAGTVGRDPCAGVDCSDFNDCTADVCTEGVCSNPAIADGASCDGGSCQSGQCVPQADPCEGVDCSDGKDCTADFCVDGSCVNSTVADGVSCQDGAGSCVAGECVIPAGCEGVDCDDDNDCTEDSCEAGVCSNVDLSDGQLCQAGAGTCQSGDCVVTDLCEGVSCDDGEECTTDSCLAGVCSNVDVADGSSCAGGTGACESGSCEPIDLCAGVSCSDGNACTADVCTEGVCSNPAIADGASCDGGSGACQSGGCVPIADPCEGVNCSDGNACTADVCTEGVCSNPDMPGGMSCDGGSGSCQSGVCVPDVDPCAGVSCSDGNDCTADVCTNGVCSNPNVADGSSCAGGGSCESGVCQTSNDLADALDGYCAKLVECNLLNSSPEPAFTSIESCKAEDSVANAYAYAVETGGACAEAFLNQWKCYAENECYVAVPDFGSGAFYAPFCEEPRLTQPEIDCPGFFQGL